MADIGPDDFTESEDLLNSLTYGIRKFYLAGSWDDMILGVMLEETQDSFLIALPAKITKNENVSILEEVMESPYVRFMKSDFRAVTFASGIHKRMYVEYLILKSPSTFPELLDMIGEKGSEQNQSEVAPHQQMHEDLQRLSEIDISEASLIEEQVELTTSAGEGILVQGPISDKELKTKVEKALEEGRFLPPQGKLPN